MVTLVLLCCVAVVLGDAPTSQSAGAATDAFRSFLLDIQEGNPADLAKLCIARGVPAQSLLRDFMDLASAMGYLRSTVIAKFGPDAVDSVLPPLPTLGDLDVVKETVNGDRAELSGESVWPIHLIRIQGRWELDLDWLAQSDDMPVNPRWFGLMAKAIRGTISRREGSARPARRPKRCRRGRRRFPIRPGPRLRRSPRLNREHGANQTSNPGVA